MASSLLCGCLRTNLVCAQARHPCLWFLTCMTGTIANGLARNFGLPAEIGEHPKRLLSGLTFQSVSPLFGFNVLEQSGFICSSTSPIPQDSLCRKIGASPQITNGENEKWLGVKGKCKIGTDCATSGFRLLLPTHSRTRLGSGCRNLSTQPSDGIVQPLASFPELPPQIAFLLKARRQCFDIQCVGLQAHP